MTTLYLTNYSDYLTSFCEPLSPPCVCVCVCVPACVCVCACTTVCRGICACVLWYYLLSLLMLCNRCDISTRWQTRLFLFLCNAEYSVTGVIFLFVLCPRGDHLHHCGEGQASHTWSLQSQSTGNCRRSCWTGQRPQETTWGTIDIRPAVHQGAGIILSQHWCSPFTSQPRPQPQNQVHPHPSAFVVRKQKWATRLGFIANWVVQQATGLGFVPLRCATSVYQKFDSELGLRLGLDGSACRGVHATRKLCVQAWALLLPSSSLCA